MIGLHDNSIENISDWVELFAIYKGKPVSKALIAKQLESTDVGEISEETVDSAINELDRRSRLYGNVSPFTVSHGIVSPKVNWIDVPELIMCLIFSVRGVIKEEGKDDGTKLFERLSKEAVNSYFGGKAKIVGFPEKRGLKDQIQSLAEELCEEIGHEVPTATTKDARLDIIAWKPHGDGRPNQLILLVQCGAGKHWPDKKSIQKGRWAHRYFHMAMEPIRGLTNPEIVADRDLKDYSDDYSLIFDRVRIYRAIKERGPLDRALHRSIYAWCKKNINK